MNSRDLGSRQHETEKTSLHVHNQHQSPGSGVPLKIGRNTRIWPVAIDRAIRAWDRHCQFTGCYEHRYLDIHHIVHRSDGGETSVENGKYE